jgi:hypothetical protein
MLPIIATLYKQNKKEEAHKKHNQFETISDKIKNAAENINSWKPMQIFISTAFIYK